MNVRTRLLGALVSISLSVCGSFAFAYNVGDVVEVQPSMMKNPAMGMWYRGKVTGVKGPGMLIVVADDGTEYLISTDPPKWIRAASPVSPGAVSTGMTQGAVTGAAAGTSQLSTNPTTSGVPLSSFSSGRTQARPSQAQTTAASATAGRIFPAKGLPPNGEYTCMKISSGSLIGLGTLEIRNGTYRGLSKDGGFSPIVTNSDGTLGWSAGLRGMPDGWKITDSRYIGGDEHGRPLIKIYYRSKSGWNEVMDALKEH